MPLARDVLVPVDFSDAANLALEAARMLAVEGGAQLTLAHVFDPRPLSPVASMHPGDVGQLLVEAEVEAQIHSALEELGRARLGELPFRTALILAKNAAQGICDYARKEDVDLIVVSTHGRTGLAHTLIGSVAENVVRYAPCPVLTLRSKARS